MQYLFLKKNLRKLSSCPFENILLAFDFDGTLTKITSRPQATELSPKTRNLLYQLAREGSTAVVSGRSLTSLKSKLGQMPAYLIGNHGIESSEMKPGSLVGLKKDCKNWGKSFKKVIKANHLEKDIEIEDKIFSLSLHYRCSNRKPHIKEWILFQASKLAPPPRIILGKAVVNLVSKNALNKGTALLAIMKKLGLRNSFYIGDDITDEDVFTLPGALANQSVFTVRVGKKKTSKAKYFIKRQSEINRLLKVLHQNKLDSSGKLPKPNKIAQTKNSHG